MRRYVLSHLSNGALRRDLHAAAADTSVQTAWLLAHIAEFDDRKLYLAEGYDSMHAYCVGELHFSEDSAYKRIRAARAARRFPVLFDAIARGRLHLSAVGLLAAHLTEANATEVIDAATHRTKVEIEAMLAARFPQPEFLPVGEVIAVPQPDTQLAPGPVDARNSLSAKAPNSGSAPLATLARVTPVSAERSLLHVVITRAAHERLKEATELLSHATPSVGVAEVIEQALELMVSHLKRRKCAKTDNPRPRRGRSRDPRHVPAHVRRAVWERDGNQCTFVGEGGHRCGSRRQLELDHIVPVAGGGESTVANLRLRCRAHNQFEAERVFGAGFMQAKRDEAQATSAARVSPANPRVARSAAALPPEESSPQDRDLFAALRELGYRIDEARHAIAATADAEATTEERLRAALRTLALKARTIRPPAPIAGGGMHPHEAAVIAV